MSVQTHEIVQPLKFARPMPDNVHLTIGVHPAATPELQTTVRALTDTIDTLTQTLEHLPQDDRYMTNRRIGQSVRHAQALLTAARAVTTHIVF